MIDIARSCAERRAAEAANDIDRLLAENAQLAEKAKRFEQVANELRGSHLDALETISNGIAREDAMRAEIARLGDKLCAEQVASSKAIAELNERIKEGRSTMKSQNEAIAFWAKQTAERAEQNEELRKRIFGMNDAGRAARTGAVA